ncbi:MAG: hypothetical protein HY430_03990 [Candidatus Levybacteria bacterium]|nr:hypothetical protein [Candidatus Levybacteria bacterium]
MQPALQDITKLLREKGFSDQQVALFTEQLMKITFAQLYMQAMTTFSDEDIQIIENIAIDKEAHTKIKELYKERTGRDPDEEMQMYVKGLAQRIHQAVEEEQKTS